MTQHSLKFSCLLSIFSFLLFCFKFIKETFFFKQSDHICIAILRQYKKQLQRRGERGEGNWHYLILKIELIFIIYYYYYYLLLLLFQLFRLTNCHSGSTDGIAGTGHNGFAVSGRAFGTDCNAGTGRDAGAGEVGVLNSIVECSADIVESGRRWLQILALVGVVVGIEDFTVESGRLLEDDLVGEDVVVSVRRPGTCSSGIRSRIEPSLITLQRSGRNVTVGHIPHSVA